MLVMTFGHIESYVFYGMIAIFFLFSTHIYKVVSFLFVTFFIHPKPSRCFMISKCKNMPCWDWKLLASFLSIQNPFLFLHWWCQIKDKWKEKRHNVKAYNYISLVIYTSLRSSSMVSTWLHNFKYLMSRPHLDPH